MTTPKALSKKAVAILGLIADGYSYNQIVDGHPDITYLNIFSAAEEALRLCESSTDYSDRMAMIKAKYPMAYERWSDEDDAMLASMYRRGVQVSALASHFERQPSAIRSRLFKLGLSTPGQE